MARKEITTETKEGNNFDWDAKEIQENFFGANAEFYKPGDYFSKTQKKQVEFDAGFRIRSNDPFENSVRLNPIQARGLMRFFTKPDVQEEINRRADRQKELLSNA